MKSYNIYIFDLDGTLLDTLQDLTSSVNFALHKYHLPERTISEIRHFVGNGVRLLMERAVPNGCLHPFFDDIFATFRQYYLEHSLDTTKPYDGVPEMLHELKSRGCQLAVVSNKMMTATKKLTSHFFPEVDVTIGEHEASGIRKKPAPDTVHEALRQLDVDPYSSTLSAVYIGDSDVDILTAQNAGLPCISVLWGFRDRQFLTDHGATVFVKTPKDILKTGDD